MYVFSGASQPSHKASYVNLSADYKKNLTPFRILLVEDTPLIQTAMAYILSEHFGYVVEVAGSGEEALVLFPRGYDLVIMDIGLPGIDGIETTKQLRRHYPDHATPIVAHSTHCDRAVKVDCNAVGMANFVEKGADPQLFNQVIEQCIEETAGLH
jgi:CheY-like chemotaxis protein